MLNKPLILTSIALVATLSFADTTDLSLVSSSVSSHPSVVKKANEVKLKGINVDQIIAENGLKIKEEQYFGDGDKIYSFTEFEYEHHEN